MHLILTFLHGFSNMSPMSQGVKTRDEFLPNILYSKLPSIQALTILIYILDQTIVSCNMHNYHRRLNHLQLRGEFPSSELSIPKNIPRVCGYHHDSTIECYLTKLLVVCQSYMALTTMSKNLTLDSTTKVNLHTHSHDIPRT